MEPYAVLLRWRVESRHKLMARYGSSVINDRLAGRA